MMCWLGILMLIGLVILMIVRAHLVGVFTWKIILSLGWIRSKNLFLSIAKAKYIAIDSCCTQLLWTQKLLLDYGIYQKHLTIYCDNTSAINISKNHVQNSWTKHIEIRHHFIRKLVKDGILTLEFINTDDKKVDIFTKLLDGC